MTLCRVCGSRVATRTFTDGFNRGFAVRFPRALSSVSIFRGMDMRGVTGSGLNFGLISGGNAGSAGSSRCMILTGRHISGSRLTTGTVNCHCTGVATGTVGSGGVSSGGAMFCTRRGRAGVKSNGCTLIRGMGINSLSGGSIAFNGIAGSRAAHRLTSIRCSYRSAFVKIAMNGNAHITGARITGREVLVMGMATGITSGGGSSTLKLGGSFANTH